MKKRNPKLKIEIRVTVQYAIYTLINGSIHELQFNIKINFTKLFKKFYLLTGRVSSIA